MSSAPTNLSLLLNTSRMNEGVWIGFNDTSFEVQVSYYGKAKMTDMVERAKVVQFNTRTMTDQETTDKERFRKEYAQAVVKNWRGLTEQVLRRLVVLGDTNLPDGYELPYNPENAEMLIQQSVEFDQWLQRVCTSVDLFNKKKAEVEAKN